jgi:polysaccharide export outer membrane protein
MRASERACEEDRDQNMTLNTVQNRRPVLPAVFARWTIAALAVYLCAVLSAPLAAQSSTQPQAVGANSVPFTPPPLPKDYVIGVEDILNVVFSSAKELSAEVLVRPDGKISLPILNDVPAAGMTPEQLAATIMKTAAKFVRESNATVIVKEIHSRKVYVVGEVARPGPFSLGSEMNVLQAIGEAGGFLEWAKKGDVVIVRNENGQERRYKFDYDDVVRGKNLQQNIRLVPGDTILVR